MAKSNFGRTLIFVLTGGAVFSDWFKTHKKISFLAAIVAIVWLLFLLGAPRLRRSGALMALPRWLVTGLLALLLVAAPMACGFSPAKVIGVGQISLESNLDVVFSTASPQVGLEVAGAPVQSELFRIEP